jgi:hypothetical protein
MIEESDAVVILEGSHGDLERVSERLARAGIVSAIVRPEKGGDKS